MPHIAIAMYPGRGQELKKKVAQALENTLSEELGVNKDVITISIHDIPQNEWENFIKQIPEDTMVKRCRRGAD